MIPQIKVEEENGYLGRIMVYKPTGEVGVVERAVDSPTGWTEQITMKLKDGSLREGKPEDFEDAVGKQRSEFFG